MAQFRIRLRDNARPETILIDGDTHTVDHDGNLMIYLQQRPVFRVARGEWCYIREVFDEMAEAK